MNKSRWSDPLLARIAKRGKMSCAEIATEIHFLQYGPDCPLPQGDPYYFKCAYNFCHRMSKKGILRKCQPFGTWEYIGANSQG